MKNILSTACLMLLAAIASSCGAKVENTPEKIAAEVIRLFQAEKFEAMKDYCSDDGAMYVDGFASTFNETPLEQGLAQKGKTVHKLVKAGFVEAGAVNMYETEADVKYRFRYDENDSWRSMIIKFEKREGDWKIIEFK